MSAPCVTAEQRQRQERGEIRRRRAASGAADRRRQHHPDDDGRAPVAGDDIVHEAVREAGLPRDQRRARPAAAIQAPKSTIASRSTMLTAGRKAPARVRSDRWRWPTQPSASAGSATTMAKNEFQKPSAERSSMRSPSALPIISRHAPARFAGDVDALAHGAPTRTSPGGSARRSPVSVSRSASATRSSTMCMVLPTRPNSTTGQ